MSRVLIRGNMMDIFPFMIIIWEFTYIQICFKPFMTCHMYQVTPVHFWYFFLLIWPCFLFHMKLKHIFRVAFHQGGLSLGWSVIGVVSQSSLSSGWFFIRVVLHYGGLSSGWSHQGSLSSGWSFIRMVFHQGGLISDLLSGWSFIRVVLSGWSFISDLSLGWFFIRVVFH